MRLDLVLPNEGEFIVDAVKSGAYFEAMGWDGLWFTDHIVGVKEYSVYGPKWIEMLTAMTYVAAQTKTIRIGSSVLVLPYRDPVITAKAIASLDILSGGRIDLGVGTGYAFTEYQAVGRAHMFKDRGAVSNEALDVMLACWKAGEINFRGRWFQVAEANFEPALVQGPRVPLWIGARSTAPATLRRAAKYADYWYPNHLSPEELRCGGETLDEMAGRHIPRAMRFIADGDPAEIADKLHDYKTAGCDAITISFLEPKTFADFDNAADALYRASVGLKQ
jgi:probable F420-dependent oxidoreductase